MSRFFVSLAVVLLAGSVAADIEFTRTVESVMAGLSGTIGVDHGCSKKDQYGSNDCDLKWGSSYNVTVNATSPEMIGTGATFDVDLKVDGLVSLKFSCPLCGGKCEFEVPIVHKKESIEMPACPLVKAGRTAMTKEVALPSKSPIPVKVSVKGDVTVKDASGKEVVKVHIDGHLH